MHLLLHHLPGFLNVFLFSFLSHLNFEILVRFAGASAFDWILLSAPSGWDRFFVVLLTSPPKNTKQLAWSFSLKKYKRRQTETRAPLTSLKLALLLNRPGPGAAGGVSWLSPVLVVLSVVCSEFWVEGTGGRGPFCKAREMDAPADLGKVCETVPIKCTREVTQTYSIVDLFK